MTKKKAAALFCETQCSDGDGDEDYIDLLIKKRGDQALNSLLRENDGLNEESELGEPIELRDSLIPQPSSQAPKIKVTSQEVQQVNLSQSDESRTPKSFIGYHKKKGTAGEKQIESLTEESKIKTDQKSYFSQAQFKPAAEQQFEMPDELPGLEHQDTIVRQVSNLSQPESEGSPFDWVLEQAIQHFSFTPLPEVGAGGSSSSQKAQEAISKQLIIENGNLKMTINKLHQKQYLLRAKNKELGRQLALAQTDSHGKHGGSQETQLLRQQVQEMHMQIQQLSSMYDQERQDKEHTEIAYKRFLQSLEREKQSKQYQGGSFLAQSAGVGDSRRSPSPLRASAQSDMKMIQQLQSQLAKKNEQINAFRQMQHTHLHSEENILDDLDEEDELYAGQQQRFYQNPVFSQHNSQSELTPYKANGRSNLQNGVGSSNANPQQFYSYEKSSQSPLGVQFSSQNSHLPTNSTYANNFFRERGQSPSPINNHYSNKYPGQHQLTSSSCSSSSHISQQQQYVQYNKQAPEKSLVQSQNLIKRNQSPSTQQTYQGKLKTKSSLTQSLAFQVNTSQSSFPQKRMQTEVAAPHMQRKKHAANQYNQHLLTNSSGSSGISGLNCYPLMSAPVMSSSGCGSDEEDL